MPIPKIIHFAWFSGEEKPQAIRECIDSWRRHCPDYDIIEWGLGDHPFCEFEWFQQAVAAKKWAFATDQFRLWVLHEHGGVYLDSDVYLNASLDPLLEHQLFIGIEKWYYLGPHAMGSLPKNPIIGRLLNCYSNRKFVRADGSYDMTAMPKIITPIFETITGNRIKGQCIQRDEFMVYSANYLTVNALDGLNVAEHRMSGSWVEGRKVNLRARFLENQLLNQALLEELTDYGHRGNSRVINIVGSILKLFRLILPYALVVYVRINFRKAERLERDYR